MATAGSTANPARILVVEDDPSLSEVVCSLLEMGGYACAPAFSGTEARMLVDQAARGPVEGVFDLVVCDLMLPGISGEDLISHVRGLGSGPGASSAARRLAEVPVIVVSAKGQVVDRVALLRSGADDYLVKPFPLEELLARVEVQLRHAARRLQSNGDVDVSEGDRTHTLRFGRWQACADGRMFEADGRPVRLTRTEFDIVWLLMSNPKRVFSRYDLLEAVHADGDLGEEKTASTHVGNIRAKLKGTGTEGYIETVWGVGFKLTADPR